jgi:hypothetical protein
MIVQISLFLSIILQINPAHAAGNGADRADLRKYADGAGPTAVFRYGRDDANKRDVLGVVDPVLWRIQFYTLDDWSPDAPLSSRIKQRGDCQLPPNFRVWRVHQFDDRIVFQSQPEFTRTALNKEQQFIHRKVTLEKSQKAILEVIDRPRTDFEKLPTTKCGDAVSFLPKDLPTFTPENDTATEVTGGGDRRSFSITPRRPAAATPAFFRRTISIPTNGSFLASAQELERAQSADGKFPMRHILLTSRLTGPGYDQPGFLTPIVTIVRQSSNGMLNRSMRLNLGLSRVKTGQKFVVVSSVGEVILIGAADHDWFRFTSCNFADSNEKKKSLCEVESELVGGTQSSPERTPEPAPSNTGAPDESKWDRAFWFTDSVYQIDARNMPCTKVEGCPVGSDGSIWSPISELRLQKEIYSKKGVPYAQSVRADGRPGPKLGISFPSAEETRQTPVPVVATHEDQPGHTFVVGDIANKGIVTSSVISVLGIDCSAFLSSLWGTPTVLDTPGFIALANGGTFTRVPTISETKIGDAFVVNLEGQINHIVMFRETRRTGPFDSSLTQLVVESSSSCGGACWSFYDESFFGGWAIIRNGREKGQKNFKPIPTKFAAWSDLFVK